MYTVGDPDLQIRKGWGSGHSDPEIRREGGRTKKKLSSLRASFWSKKKGGSGPPVPSLDPPLVHTLHMYP